MLVVTGREVRAAIVVFGRTGWATAAPCRLAVELQMLVVVGWAVRAATVEFGKNGRAELTTRF
jgi:hypothetical protein